MALALSSQWLPLRHAMSQPVWSLRAWTPLRSRASDPSPAHMSSRAAGALWTLRRGGHVPTCVRTGVAGTPGTLHPPEAPTPGTFWSKGTREHSPQGVAWSPGARGPPTSLGAPKAAGLPRQQEAHLVDCVAGGPSPAELRHGLAARGQSPSAPGFQ